MSELKPFEEAITYFEQLRRRFDDAQDETYWGKEHNATTREMIDAALDALRRAQPADVAQVVPGRWLINSDGYYPYCSECKEEPKSGIMTHYCPNCGAKMDKKEQNG